MRQKNVHPSLVKPRNRRETLLQNIGKSFHPGGCKNAHARTFVIDREAGGGAGGDLLHLGSLKAGNGRRLRLLLQVVLTQTQPPVLLATQRINLSCSKKLTTSMTSVQVRKSESTKRNATFFLFGKPKHIYKKRHNEA